MSTIAEKESVVFRNFEQYKKFFEPEEKVPDYTGKSNDYIIGAEIARKAAIKARKKMAEEDERRRSGWGWLMSQNH